MSVTFGELLIWLIIGSLAGSFIGMLATRSKKGYGRCWNLLLGMAGAVVGGMSFNGLGVDLGLGDLSISFEDLIAAFAGSLAVLLVVWSVRRFLGRKRSGE